jgi:hypothetical protein
MKSAIAPFLFAVVLALAGAGFYLAGQTEKRLADVHQQLALLRYADASSESEQVETDLGAARRVPQVGRAAATDLRDARAVATYWSGGYSAIVPQKDANGVVTETDPQILLITANAAFRSSQSDDRAATLRKLDAVVKSYGDVLRNSPGHVDAAYNYEYAIRMRDNVAKAKPAPAGKTAKATLKAVEEVLGDLPAGATVHGKPGGPPPATDMAQFKIVIPKRGEERKDNPEAGKGGVKVRKG